MKDQKQPHIAGGWVGDDWEVLFLCESMHCLLWKSCVVWLKRSHKFQNIQSMLLATLVGSLSDGNDLLPVMVGCSTTFTLTKISQQLLPWIFLRTFMVLTRWVRWATIRFTFISATMDQLMDCYEIFYTHSWPLEDVMEKFGDEIKILKARYTWCMILAVSDKRWPTWKKCAHILGCGSKTLATKDSLEQKSFY